MGDIDRALEKLDDLEAQWVVAHSDVYGISTGFPSIDKLTGGFQKGEVFVLAARTSQGKTALATQMAFNVVHQIAQESREAGEQLGKIMIYSPEMSAHMLMLRQASVLSRVPIQAIRTGTATEMQTAAWKIAKQILHTYDPYVVLKTQGDMTVEQIAIDVSVKNTSHVPTWLVVVDYIQYLTSASGRDSSYEQVSSVTKEIKDMANELEIPVLLLSQVNRKGAQSSDDDSEDVPELHELEGSGKIEARADTVGLLWRRLSEDIADDSAQQALLRIGKNRNGPIGIVPLHYYPNLTRFSDPAIKD